MLLNCYNCYFVQLFLLCLETNKNNSIFLSIFSREDPGVEDVFNALKPEMQQITSREEVGAGDSPFFPVVSGGGKGGVSRRSFLIKVLFKKGGFGSIGVFVVLGYR